MNPERFASFDIRETVTRFCASTPNEALTCQVKGRGGGQSRIQDFAQAQNQPLPPASLTLRGCNSTPPPKKNTPENVQKEVKKGMSGQPQGQSWARPKVKGHKFDPWGKERK